MVCSFSWYCFSFCARLTKKAEPPPTHGVNRDSGTASANGGWLRRLVKRQIIHLSKISSLTENLAIRISNRQYSGTTPATLYGAVIRRPNRPCAVGETLMI